MQPSAGGEATTSTRHRATRDRRPRRRPPRRRDRCTRIACASIATTIAGTGDRARRASQWSRRSTGPYGAQWTSMNERYRRRSARSAGPRSRRRRIPTAGRWHVGAIRGLDVTPGQGRRAGSRPRGASSEHADAIATVTGEVAGEADQSPALPPRSLPSTSGVFVVPLSRATDRRPRCSALPLRLLTLLPAGTARKYLSQSGPNMKWFRPRAGH